MARTLTETPVTTRNARAKLAPGLYWRAIDASVHLGYRRGKRSGVWLVRWRNGVGYRQAPIGSADDSLEADGKDTLSYSQAVVRARTIVEERRAAAVFEAEGPAPTVRSVCESYLAAIEARKAASGRTLLKDARSRLTTHVLGDEIADTFLHSLTAESIRAWRARVRDAASVETTLRRIATDFRAAIRRAGAEFRAKLPSTFMEEVRAGFAVGTSDPPARSARPNIVLPDADVRRLIAAAAAIDDEDGWEGDLHRLVIALAATGARFSQLAKATVGDLQIGRKRLMVPSSGKGRGAKRQTSVAVALGEDVLEVLKPAFAGRLGHEPLFERWGYKRAGRLEWTKDKRRGWAPSDLTEPFRSIAERAGLPAEVSAYSLRHSSIVRGLRAGLPVRLVAALHDTSTAMIEKHYAAFIVDALDELAARAVVPLATPAAQIVPISKLSGYNGG